MEKQMRLAIAVLMLVLLTAFTECLLPADADAKRGIAVWRMAKGVRKVPVRMPRSSILGDIAVGAAGAWAYDQLAAPEEGEESSVRDTCVDCGRPYRERKELEEKCRKKK